MKPNNGLAMALCDSVLMQLAQADHVLRADGFLLSSETRTERVASAGHAWVLRGVPDKQKWGGGLPLDFFDQKGGLSKAL